MIKSEPKIKIESGTEKNQAEQKEKKKRARNALIGS